MVSKGRVVGCAQEGSHGTTTCFQCESRATSACAHLPAAFGCACPSLFPSPPHLLPHPLQFPALFSSTCSIFHALLQSSLPQPLPVLTPVPRHQSQAGTTLWGFPSLAHPPGFSKPLFESPKPSWGWDFSETPSYPCFSCHACASSPWAAQNAWQEVG